MPTIRQTESVNLGKPITPSVAYSVEVDFNKNNAYDHADSDITTYVLDMRWKNGMDNADQEVANPAKLTLTLDNSGGQFNLEEASAPYYELFKPGLLVRIRATFDMTTYTLFIGKLSQIPQLEFAADRRLTVKLEARDMMPQLLNVEFIPDLLTNVRTDECIQHVYDKAVIALPYYSSYWVMEDSASQLGVNTTLVDTSLPSDLEAGVTTLEYFGDNVGEERSTRAQTYIRNAVSAELGGRFYYDTRTGKFTFHNRHHDINPTAAITVTKSDFYDPDYEPQTEVFNATTVHYTPRELGSVNSILWRNQETFKVDVNETREIIARYTDPDNPEARVGAQDIPTTINKGSDFVANQKEDGSGVDTTTRLDLSVEHGANSALIKIGNQTFGPHYVMTLIIRGTPIKSYARESFTYQDIESVTENDPRYLPPRTLNAVGDSELVEAYTKGLVSQYRTARAVFRKIKIRANKSDTYMTWVLARNIGDAIRLTNTEIGHDKIYVIIGERHRVSGGSQPTHDVEWLLKSPDQSIYWTLEETGYSELGETTVLAF